MQPSPPALAVGIVLYQNQRDELVRLLASLEQARRTPRCPPFSLAWFDNTCSEAYRAELAALGISPIASTGENLGFGRAHNVLMARAFSLPQTRWYLCLNPDAMVHPDMMTELLEQAGRMARPGLVEAAQFPAEHPKAYDPQTHATGWCSGCALLVSRALHEEIGGFDEQIFLYCEDVDLSWRARAAGFDIAIAPSALVHHFTHNRPPGGRTRLEMVRAGAYLAAKWGGKEFGARCRREYEEATGTRLELPPVQPPTEQMRRVADFSANFHFARARW